MYTRETSVQRTKIRKGRQLSGELIIWKYFFAITLFSYFYFNWLGERVRIHLNVRKAIERWNRNIRLLFLQLAWDFLTLLLYRFMLTALSCTNCVLCAWAWILNLINYSPFVFISRYLQNINFDILKIIEIAKFPPKTEIHIWKHLENVKIHRWVLVENTTSSVDHYTRYANIYGIKFQNTRLCYLGGARKIFELPRRHLNNYMKIFHYTKLIRNSGNYISS